MKLIILITALFITTASADDATTGLPPAGFVEIMEDITRGFDNIQINRHLAQCNKATPPFFTRIKELIFKPVATYRIKCIANVHFIAMCERRVSRERGFNLTSDDVRDECGAALIDKRL